MTDQQSFIRITQFIAFALIMGVSLFTCVVLLQANQLSFDTNSADLFMIIVPVMSLGAAIMSKILFNKTVNEAINSGLSQKKQAFQTATIISLAILEGIGLMSTVQLMLSGNLYYLVFTVALVAAMLLSFPTKSKFINVFQLSRDEIKEI